MKIRINSIICKNNKKSLLLSLCLLILVLTISACAPASNPELLTGYMVIDDNILHLDRVEIIKAEDEDRIEELELNQQVDMPNGYYIYNADIEKQTYELTKETEYYFVDINLLFVKENDGDRVYTTTEKEEFLLHLNESYSDSPPAQKVPFFIEVKDGKVISITEKIEFTI